MIAREQELAIAHAATPRSTLREVLTPAVLLYTLAYFCLTNTLSAINIWTPQILQSFNTGSSNIVIGLLAAIPQFCTILGMIWWSRRSDRLKERKAHYPAVSFAAAGWMLASATDHNLIQLLGIIMASTGSFTAMAIFWTTPDQVISLQSRAVALAVINAIGNVGSAVSPLLIGILRDATGSFSSGLWFVAGLLVVGALVLTRIPMTRRESLEREPDIAAQRSTEEPLCVRAPSPTSISARSTTKVWAPTMCTTSRSPAWRPFWPRHAGAPPRPVFSDAFSRHRAD